jgi:hypothetical protein
VFGQSLAEDFSAADRATLAELAEQLWAERPAIAANVRLDRGARPAGLQRGPLTLDLLRAANDAPPPCWRRCATAPDTLCTTYYQLNRRLIDVERERTLGRRVHLADLYESARFAMTSLEARVPPSAVFGKLTTRLTMLVGLAYSDAREEALEAARDELQHEVAERTAELASQESLADSIIATLPGIFFLSTIASGSCAGTRARTGTPTPAEIAGRHPLDSSPRTPARISPSGCARDS